MNKLSQGIFLIGMAALTAALSVMSCGGGGGGGGSAAAAGAQAGGGAVIHVSSPDPAIVLPASTISLIRTVQWTAAANECPLQYLLEGTFTTSVVGSAQAVIRIYNLSGSVNLFGGGPVSLSGPGTNKPFGMLISPPVLNNVGIAWSHPPQGYRVVIEVTTPAGGSWIIDTTTVKIVTVTATPLSPSPAMIEL